MGSVRWATPGEIGAEWAGRRWRWATWSGWWLPVHLTLTVMKPACPKCFAAVPFQTHGGLFSVHCNSCGWHEEGACNGALFSSMPSKVFVAKANAPVSAAALKTIRSEHAAARAMSLDALRDELSSEGGLWIGDVPLHREHEIATKLSAVGIWLEAQQHEEG